MMNDRKMILIGGGHLLVQEILDAIAHSALPVKKIQLVSEGDGIGEIYEFRNQPVLVIDVTDMIEEDYDVAILLSEMKDLEKITRDLVLGGVPLIDMANHFEASPEIPVLLPDSGITAKISLPMIGIIPVREAQALMTVLKALDTPDGNPISWKQATMFSLNGVSCMGSRQAMDELFDQTRNILGFSEVVSNQFPRQIAFNAFHRKGDRLADRILQSQSRYLCQDLVVTCDRAWCGFFVGILGTLWMEADAPVQLEPVIRKLAQAADIQLRDDVEGALGIVGQDKLVISDVRTIQDNSCCLTLRFGMDNLLKGSASTLIRLLESAWMEVQS